MNNEYSLQKIKEDILFWEYLAKNTNYYEINLEDIKKIKWLIEQLERCKEIFIDIEECACDIYAIKKARMALEVLK